MANAIRIRNRAALKRFERPGNQIIVVWVDSRPSVLTWNAGSWRDKQDRGYAIDPTWSYKVYRFKGKKSKSW